MAAVQQSLVGLTSRGVVPRRPDLRQQEIAAVESDIDQVAARLERARLEGDYKQVKASRVELQRLGRLRSRLRFRS